jgi:hypothetical protein
MKPKGQKAKRPKGQKTKRPFALVISAQTITIWLQITMPLMTIAMCDI